jgi:hypothetical protein
MAWWFAPDVTSWAKSADESMGRRPKQWVLDPTGTEWLRKEPLSWRASELAIEATTLELARRCGYPVAFGTCCTWRREDGDVVRGFVSRKFQEGVEEQTTGGQLIATRVTLPEDLNNEQSERMLRVKTTPELTREVLLEEQRRYSVDLIRPFVRMLVFDAWIGNVDRHSANWAILVRNRLHGSACRLAPMYDTAGCLLAELKEETVQARFANPVEMTALKGYIAKCPSGFGDGRSTPNMPHETLLDTLQTWPEWQECAPALISFFSNNLAMVDSVLKDVPDGWLTPRRKQLIRQLLEGRGKMLL